MSLGGAVQAADCLLVCRQSTDELLTSYLTKPETDEKHENKLKAEHGENLCELVVHKEVVEVI